MCILLLLEKNAAGICPGITHPTSTSVSERMQPARAFENSGEWLSGTKTRPGKHTKNDGKSPFFMGKSENPLFLWPCSIAMMLVYQSVAALMIFSESPRLNPQKLLLLLIAHPSFHPIYLWSTSRSVCVQGPSLQIGVPLNPLASQCSIHFMLQFWGVHLFETHHISSH